MLHRRRSLPPELCLRWSGQAQQRLTSLPDFERAASVAVYSPVLNEVFTEAIFDAGRDCGKRMVYPRVREGLLEFVSVGDRGRLQRGAFGILEPSGEADVSLGEVDLLIVPGVAFDEKGYRIGFGKGFYDRALHAGERPPLVVGFCYDFQLLPSLPVEDHDVAMDMVVTERRDVRCSKQGSKDLNP